MAARSTRGADGQRPDRRRAGQGEAADGPGHGTHLSSTRRSPELGAEGASWARRRALTLGADGPKQGYARNDMGLGRVEVDRLDAVGARKEHALKKRRRAEHVGCRSAKVVLRSRPSEALGGLNSRQPAELPDEGGGARLTLMSNIIGCRGELQVSETARDGPSARAAGTYHAGQEEKGAGSSEGGGVREVEEERREPRPHLASQRRRGFQAHPPTGLLAGHPGLVRSARARQCTYDGAGSGRV
jgi:hypothetical protein